MSSQPYRVVLIPGDGIGPEVIVKALSDPALRHKARYII
jgi:isocitrate/isopropylmalate dehydrogenase